MSARPLRTLPLTPPYHFSIAACSPPSSNTPIDTPDNGDEHEQDVPCQHDAHILYRGALPAARNLHFIRRLNLCTILSLAPAPPGPDGTLARFAERHGVEVKWIKADAMGEEKLGMGKNEVGEVLKTLLDTSLYPLYITDADGKTHTSLIVACLRRLQGWHMDSIMREVEQFEPDYEDLPLQSFITSFLTGTSSDPLQLPLPPYPPWLWPMSQAPSPSSLSRAGTTREGKVERERSESGAGPVSSAPASGQGKERERERERSGRDDKSERSERRDNDERRERDRDRTVSGGGGGQGASGGVATANNILPFPHPHHARRHPTMRLAFPPAVPPPAVLSRTNSRREKGERERERDREREREKDKERRDQNDAAAVQLRDGASVTVGASGSTSPRLSSILGFPLGSAAPSASPPSAQSSTDEYTSLVAAATSIVTAGLDTLSRVISPSSSTDHSQGHNQDNTSAHHTDSSPRTLSSPLFPALPQSAGHGQSSSAPGELARAGDVPADADRSAGSGSAMSSRKNTTAGQARPARMVSFRRESSTSVPSSPTMLQTPLPPLVLPPGAVSDALDGASGRDAPSENGTAVSGLGIAGAHGGPALKDGNVDPDRRAGAVPRDDDVLKHGEGGGSPTLRDNLTAAAGAPVGAADGEQAADDYYDDDYDDDDDYDEEDEDEEDEDEEEDEDDVQPTALHISALDLAGYG